MYFILIIVTPAKASFVCCFCPRNDFLKSWRGPKSSAHRTVFCLIMGACLSLNCGPNCCLLFESGRDNLAGNTFSHYSLNSAASSETSRLQLYPLHLANDGDTDKWEEIAIEDTNFAYEPFKDGNDAEDEDEKSPNTDNATVESNSSSALNDVIKFFYKSIFRI